MHKRNKRRKYLQFIIIMLITASASIAVRCFLTSENKRSNPNVYETVPATENAGTEDSGTQIIQTAEPHTEPVQTDRQDTDISDAGSNELFAKFYEPAEKLLQNMTLEEKIGQMFLARFPKNGVIEEIQNYYPGGYILFARDFKNETPESILSKLKECQNTSKIKMILGVDEEGGTVVRVSAYEAFRRDRFLSPQQLWANGQLPAILDDSKEKSALLKSIGLNMNLAPVADVPTDPSSFIFDRSYGTDPKETAVYVSELIKAMNEDGMISVMKHFPGYGDNADTHTGIAVDERPYDMFTNSDFLPFISGIEAGGPCILVSHNIIKSMDADKPASLSKNVHDILRTDLNFSGIIMTDDLAMAAVKSYAENGEAAVLAVSAGNDMIISSDLKGQSLEILNAVKQGKIDEAQIDKAVKRILALKLMYKIEE